MELQQKQTPRPLSCFINPLKERRRERASTLFHIVFVGHRRRETRGLVATALTSGWPPLSQNDDVHSPMQGGNQSIQQAPKPLVELMTGQSNQSCYFRFFRLIVVS